MKSETAPIAPLLVDEKTAQSVYLLRRNEGLPFVKLGSRTLYDPRDLAKWIEARKAGQQE